MIAAWIGIAAAGASLLVWRLRRAAKVLDGILRDERERSDVEMPPVEHRNR